ncbi:MULTISPECIES: chaperone NapD [Uliginosibacterium]|uniref:Chaperone NapD n=1 Tax=Uliginosibacterium aquaticum TaxID=2731212 RepID=A0ABX2IGG5_9RHOO|nr:MULTISPECIES: chaperone NapD [Uliginosibacterium]MDO6386380.1 chaperone NapD [Uliginosibacterium sp. 31-12]NSL53426.1 chaperone NapD [Uliginosibacterium aquaticum]
MKIVSLLVRVRPEQAAEVAARLVGIAGVSLHGTTPDGGRLVVMLEDGEGYAVTDSILAVSVASGVLGTTLAYEYTDEEVTPDELAAAMASSKKRHVQEMQA